MLAEREHVGGTIPYSVHRRAANVAQSMLIAGVCRRTIYNWVQANRVEWFRTPGGQLRIYVDTLRRFSED